MMQLRDWIAMIVGFFIGAAGVLPILHRFKVGKPWFALDFLNIQFIVWIVAVAAVFLIYTSIIEITNSSSIGWWSFLIAIVVLLLGLIPLLHSINYAPGWLPKLGLGSLFFNIIFIVEGLFLFVSGFAMEI